MPEIGNSPQTPPASRRRRFGISLILFAVGALAIAGVSLVFAPLWLPRLLSDDSLIHYERTQRRLRADFGLPLPGQPDLTRVSQRLAESGLKQGAPILIRIYKREFQLELWMQRDGVFHRFATYPICRWSGELGPKLQQGDSQAPEGFYTVDAAALNPNSRWYRSFNLGYPNAFDRDKGRTGSLIMVHGGCASIGCFAMTNAPDGRDLAARDGGVQRRAETLPGPSVSVPNVRSGDDQACRKFRHRVLAQSQDRQRSV